MSRRWHRHAVGGLQRASASALPARAYQFEPATASELRGGNVGSEGICRLTDPVIVVLWIIAEVWVPTNFLRKDYLAVDQRGTLAV